MAVYDLEEQDKIDELKAWWTRYGNTVLSVVIAACIAIVAVQGWRWYRSSQAEQASVLYNAVSAAQRANDVNQARDATSQLVDKYAATGYAPRAALVYAKMLWDAGDKAGAKAQLQWVIDRADEEELKQVARYRLAEALLDDKQYDGALALLDAKTTEPFAGLYADLRGDALAAAGRKDEARTAYQSAIAKLDAKSPYRNFVQVKLDAVGGPPAAAAATGSAGGPAVAPATPAAASAAPAAAPAAPPADAKAAKP